MSLPSGLASQWYVLDETTYGVAPTLTGGAFTNFDSDTVELKKATKEGAGIYSGALVAAAARRVLTEWRVQGGTVGDLPAQGLNKWLLRMFGSFAQANATLTQIATSGVYKSVHYPGALEGHTFSLQKGVADVGGTMFPETEVGCKVSEWELSATMGEIVKWTQTIEGRNELATNGPTDPLNASVPALVSPYAAPPGGVFYWSEGAILYGGTPSTTSNVTSITSPTAAGLLKSISLKFTRPLDLERFSPELAGYRNEPLQNGLIAITGQMVVEFLSTPAYYAAFSNDTATALQLTFTGPVVGTSGTNHSLLGLLMSNIRLDGESVKTPGPAVLTQTIPFTVLDDRVNNTLQATYQTVDST